MPEWRVPHFECPRKIALLLLLVVAAVATSVWMTHYNAMKQLPPREKEAMEFLPGYSFILDGKEFEIRRKWTHRSFQVQHGMIPFLTDMVPRMKRWNWTKDWPPLEITETEETVVITIPGWPPKPEVTYCRFGGDYCSQVTFDKKTGKIISAWSGG